MSESSAAQYEALLLVSFGGPEGQADVIPFLENVLRGRNVPPERMLEVAEHYRRFGGVSPINAQNRALIASLRLELDRHGASMPIYWGNRNWRPFLAEAIGQMADDGIRKALAFVTSAFSSYSGCRQYRENIAQAQAEVGSRAPQIDKLRAYYNHPGFLEAVLDGVTTALASIPLERRSATRIVFTAHSIPLSMAETCRYEFQLDEACRLLIERLGPYAWKLVYQSRSGPPQQAWLEPDVVDHLRELAAKQARDVVIVPLGFVSDHLEVLYDLDTEARAECQELGLNMIRASTAGTHPKFVSMIRELIDERLGGISTRRAWGASGPCPDACPIDCCPPPARPTGRPQVSGEPDSGRNPAGDLP